MDEPESKPVPSEGGGAPESGGFWQWVETHFGIRRARRARNEQGQDPESSTDQQPASDT